VVNALLSEQRQILQALLVQIRTERGLVQEDIAAALGRHQSDVSKYERGHHRLDLPELDLVCKAIGISRAQLLKRYEAALRHGGLPEAGIHRRVYRKKTGK
jgi:transcriptional regulator with XRE-family HTH domain